MNNKGNRLVKAALFITTMCFAIPSILAASGIKLMNKENDSNNKNKDK